MSLTVELSGSQDDAKRKGYKITGIRLSTNLHVNKRHVDVPITKRMLDFLCNTLDLTRRRDAGKTAEQDQIMVVVPVKSNNFYSPVDLDEQTSNVRLQLSKRYGLVPAKGNYQFFVKLTLISSDGINQYHTQLLSYVSNKSDESCQLYYDIHSKIVHYDEKGHVIPLLAADKEAPLLDVIDIISTD